MSGTDGALTDRASSSNQAPSDCSRWSVASESESSGLAGVTGRRRVPKWVVGVVTAAGGGFPRHFLVCSRKLDRVLIRSPAVDFSTFNSAPAVLPPISPKIIMEQQFYQPLSAALHPPLVQTNRSPQSHYPAYVPHGHTATSNGTDHTHREEEEEEDDDEEVVEEELEHREHHSPSAHSSPRVSVGQSTKSAA